MNFLPNNFSCCNQTMPVFFSYSLTFRFLQVPVPIIQVFCSSPAPLCSVPSLLVHAFLSSFPVNHLKAILLQHWMGNHRQRPSLWQRKGVLDSLQHNTSVLCRTNWPEAWLVPTTEQEQQTKSTGQLLKLRRQPVQTGLQWPAISCTLNWKENPRGKQTFMLWTADEIGLVLRAGI